MSKRALAIASGLSLACAMLILVTAVLPAEYGVDPLGTGRLLGLSALSGAALDPIEPPRGEILAPVHEGLVALYPGEYKVDARTISLGPYEYVEYKYHLAKDATMLFSWQASGNVIHDFHGDPDGAAATAVQSYDKKPRRRADGSFTAPFSGIHGWYWENPGGDPITIHLATAGFYSEAHEFNFDGTRRRRDVQASDVIPVSDN